jgi:hypothetical protein
VSVSVGNDVTASIAPTQAADAAAISGTVNNRIALAATQAVDVAAVGATVTNRVSLAPTQAADTAAVQVIAGSLNVSIAATQAPDTAAIVVQLPSTTTGAGSSRRNKRRRVVLGDQVYDVLERDLPTLLEAVMLNRKPPATAQVQAAPEAAPVPELQITDAPAMRAPLPSVDEARARYEAMLTQINQAATADVAALLQRVADRVLADLQDDEDAAVALLLH